MFGVAVAVCPPPVMLLAVEPLNRALKRHRAETTTPNAAPWHAGEHLRSPVDHLSRSAVA
jgi:hypothetical protein